MIENLVKELASYIENIILQNCLRQKNESRALENMKSCFQSPLHFLTETYLFFKVKN